MEFAVAVSLPKGFAQPGWGARIRHADRASGRMIASGASFTAATALAVGYFLSPGGVSDATRMERPWSPCSNLRAASARRS
jgi:hypothetical protein